MKFIKLDNVTIQKHLVLDMPYHNVVQTACQDGDITALLLHGNNKAYLFRQNLNNVQNKVLKFDNNPLLVLSNGAYGHTQSLIHAQELFVGNWIYTSCGSGVYTTHSKWGLDIMRFNGDYPAKYDDTNFKDMQRLTNFKGVLQKLQQDYHVDRIPLQRVEFTMSSRWTVLVMLIDSLKNIYFICYLMDDISSLMSKATNNVADATELDIQAQMRISFVTLRNIRTSFGIYTAMSFQGLALGDDKAIYISSGPAPKYGLQPLRFILKINNFDTNTNNWSIINFTEDTRFDQYTEDHSIKLLTESEGIYLDTMSPNDNLYQIIAYHNPTNNETVKNIIWHITW